ncbi:MAG TPA: BMP family ABC transporter substrate-binding protein [Anaerolineales bacterium]|nr:BMP family ABC transporter substrate-binding protein [Anaerolineales bacterium]HRK88147.1 BMP family ABC transporter substrate-binding protein [Anaerolineales bacterium]
MQKNFARLAAMLALATLLVLVACGGPAPVEPPSTDGGGGSSGGDSGSGETAPTVEVPSGSGGSSDEPFVFGMLLVGPYNDNGWSQAHYEAGLYLEENLNAKMVYLDKVNPADRPGTTPDQLAEELVAQGAKLVIFNSDDMKDASTTFAKNNPDIYVIMASGDQVWQDGKAFQEIPNLMNIMGRMEYGKMIGGCAAALSTETGKIGYLGPLINDETRRLAASAYLGAKYCYEMAGNDPAELDFKVTWIGFWFNIPGVTLDPVQVSNDFYTTDYDIVISGIDNPVNLGEAAKLKAEGKAVAGVAYDYVAACEAAPDVCLGVPYFNWGPEYLKAINSAIDGSWQSQFIWAGPDWADLNNHDTSTIGFEKGPALSADDAAMLDGFIAELAGGLNLWTGPINLQDGSAYLADGEVASDQQVWYLPQLLEGMEGLSAAE